MYAKMKYGMAWHLIKSRHGTVILTVCGILLKGSRVVEAEHAGFVCMNCEEEFVPESFT